MSTFSFTFKKLNLYRPVLDHVLNDPSGDVGKYLAKRGQLIVVAAKRQVGVDTGILKNSIHVRHTRDSNSQQLWIGSLVNHALIHHEGSRPHMIFGHNRGMMRFSSGGRQVYTRAVRHPGTRPNRYLSDNLQLIRS